MLSRPKALLFGTTIAIGLFASVLTTYASNPSIAANRNTPCPVEGHSYAAPAGYSSYSFTHNYGGGYCSQSPWGARDEAYFWDGGWWGIVVTDPEFAMYSRTLYSAAVAGFHQNAFPFSPYARSVYTYAP